MDDEPEAHKDLLELISKFRDDEEEHHQVGIKMDGEKAPLFALMKQTIQLGCKSAIWLSERI